jgi:hypothetical protein
MIYNREECAEKSFLSHILAIEEAIDWICLERAWELRQINFHSSLVNPLFHPRTCTRLKLLVEHGWRSGCRVAHAKNRAGREYMKWKIAINMTAATIGACSELYITPS